MFLLMNFQDSVSVLIPSCTLVPKASMPQKIGTKNIQMSNENSIWNTLTYPVVSSFMP